MEEFKGHSYPDVLVSVLIKTLTEFRRWLETAAINPATKTTWWQKLFGAKPTKSAYNKAATRELSAKFENMIGELNDLLLSTDEQRKADTVKTEAGTEVKASAQAGLKSSAANISSEVGASARRAHSLERRSEYVSLKIEALHRNLMRYKTLFEDLNRLSGGSAYLLLDDLYHIRRSDQPEVIDYFHRIAKGCSLWLKVGTIRHRTTWYIYGDPPRGMKLGDDGDEIDLDVTLEKYELTKRFLMQILGRFAAECDLRIDDMLTDGAKDRLVLASGGVARDFLTIFRRTLDVVAERIASGDLFRGEKIGAEDVNKAAGEFDKFKREDFTRDTGSDDRDRLMSGFGEISNFCISKSKANCFLIEKDLTNDLLPNVEELVDLKFLHLVKSRVTVRDRVGRLYDAFMLDVSQYTGERARQGFELIRFWGKGADDALRKTKLILAERNT
jgi:hypothetical protein